MIPVALASAVAASIRVIFNGSAPVFPIANLQQPSDSALAFYTVVGALVGLAAVGISRFVYATEDVYERVGKKLHIHWMWWPAIGALTVGTLGLVDPRILGVGYSNIIGALSGTIVGRALIILVVLKFLAWALYLGSGTSGGILAPLFTLGSGLGAYIGARLLRRIPERPLAIAVAVLLTLAGIKELIAP